MKRFEIRWINLDPTIGAEMKKTRPCLIVSPDEMNAYVKTVIIVPLTSTKRELPTRVLIRATPKSGLTNNSYAAVDQIKTVDKIRIGNLLGEPSEVEKQAVSAVLREMFDY